MFYIEGMSLKKMKINIVNKIQIKVFICTIFLLVGIGLLYTAYDFYIRNVIAMAVPQAICGVFFIFISIYPFFIKEETKKMGPD
jgi:hypothetical protein